MHTRHIHIAVLDTDVPVPQVYTARGLYSSQFRVLLQAAAARVSRQRVNHHKTKIQIHISAYDVVGGAYPAAGMLRKTAIAKPPTTALAKADEDEDKDKDGDEDAFHPIDAFLITGAAAAAYDKGEEQYKWIAQLHDFIRRVWTHYPAVKWFGSCFGHQIIAQALLANDGDEQYRDLFRMAAAKNTTSSSSIRVIVEKCSRGHEVGLHPITLNPDFAASTELGRMFSKALSANGRDGKLRLQLVHGDRVIGLDLSDLDSMRTRTKKGRTMGNEEEDGDADAAHLPAPWLNIGSTAYAPIQGLYYPDRVLTYQGHFEFDAFVNTETVREFGTRLGWSERTINAFLKQINDCGGTDDSELAADMVVHFLADDCGVSTHCVEQWQGNSVSIEYSEKGAVVQSVEVTEMSVPV